MSTRSYIGYCDNGFKNIKFVYCHWDGYVEYNGVLLNEHYNDIDKIKELIRSGDFSSLKENVSDITYYNESLTPVHFAENLEELAKSLPSIDFVYLYVVSSGTWYVSNTSYIYDTKKEDFIPLASEIARIEEENRKNEEE